MRISELYEFIEHTDVSGDMPPERREKVAMLGLIGEIGSVLAALKKHMLAPPGDEAGVEILARGELREQIGDAIWYAIMLAQRLDDPRARNIFQSNFEMLRRQLSGRARHDRRVQEELGEPRCSEFLAAVEAFGRLQNPSIDEYQRVAFITRRTNGDTLRDVCAAVLQQLSAQLGRSFLPTVEMALNHEVYPKDPVDALGEIVWHLSALARLYHLELSSVMQLTREKAEFRNSQNRPGPAHDSGEEYERFPERFEVHFVPVDARKTNMFWLKEGAAPQKLGATLTDNAHEEDGYRFHDVMHVAFATHLHWSPNLRAFMNLKRKSLKNMTDEVEDGGRAKILEEAVILEIHRQAQIFDKFREHAGEIVNGSPYEYPGAISFEFLRRLHELCEGHEAYANPKQDWERAILDGYRCYHQLRTAKGGIIAVDMVSRTLAFRDLPQPYEYDYPPDRSKCPCCGNPKL